MCNLRIAAVAATMALLLSLPAAGGPAVSVRSSYQLLPAFDVPATPNNLDRIAFVRYRVVARSDPPGAVLILVPGHLGGAEDFRLVGQRLATRLPWLEVWAVDRRNNLLENRCGMERAQRAQDPRIATAYYLLGQDLAGCPKHLDPDPATWNGSQAEFALSQPEARSLGMARWGLATELEDLRRLIAYAHQKFPQAKVFLGGHSLGGMTAQLYAGWRFGFSPDSAGWHSIDGVVLIDGGVDGPNWASGLIPQYGAERTMVNTGTVYWDDLALGATPLLGQFAEIGAMAASLAPTRESFLWQVLPPPFQWPNSATCPTNKAIFAAFSDDTGPFTDFRIHQGAPVVPVDLNGDGLPDFCAAPNANRLLVHWLDFNQTSPPELASTDTFARALWESRATNGIEWYFSIMLNADIDLASNLDSRAPFIDPLTGQSTTAEALEGHRVLDTTRVAVPVLAFAAAECRGRFEWYRSVATSVPSFTIVDHSAGDCPSPAAVPYVHLDALFAADTGGFVNAFIASVADWLQANRQLPVRLGGSGMGE